MSDFFEEHGDEAAASALERRMRAAERREAKTRGTASAVIAGTLAAVLIFGGGLAAYAVATRPATKPTAITVPVKAPSKHKAKSKKAKSKHVTSAKKSS